MNVLLWLAGVGAAGVLAELLLRILRRRFVVPAVCQPGLREHLAVVQEELATQGSTVRFEVNRLGERGADPPSDGADAFRILVCGGSAAECFTLDQPQTWPEIAKRHLQTAESLRTLGRRLVHLGNVARSLALPSFVEQILLKIAPRYRNLDLIVIMTGASNTAMWLANGAPAAVEARPALPDNLFAVNPDGPYKWTIRGSALYQTIYGLWCLLFRPIKRGRVGRTIGASRKMRATTKSILTTIPDPRPMLDQFDSGFRSLIATARRMARRVLVVRQPWFDKDEFSPQEQAAFWHGAAGHPHLGSVEAFYSFEIVTRLVRLVDRRAAEIADELGVEQIDLLPSLEPTLANFYDFWHFTPAGAEIVGRIVADEVLRKNDAPSVNLAGDATATRSR